MVDEFMEWRETVDEWTEEYSDSLKKVHDDFLGLKDEAFTEVKVLDRLDQLVRNTFAKINDFHERMTQIQAKHGEHIGPANVAAIEKEYQELGALYDEINMNVGKIQLCQDHFEKAHKHEHKWSRILRKHLDAMEREQTVMRNSRKVIEHVINEVKEDMRKVA